VASRYDKTARNYLATVELACAWRWLNQGRPLGALVGAGGGYGQPILKGIRVSHVPTLLEGAIPAALLAWLLQAGLAFVQANTRGRGLRQGADDG
jgi:ABC-type proline/glycine betaine transport system permease subunit